MTYEQFEKFIDSYENADEKTIEALVELGISFMNGTDGLDKNTEIAKLLFSVGESHYDPQATDFLAVLQDNHLIEEIMSLRAADRNAPSHVQTLQEEYSEQATWWRKKIAEAENKTFDGEAPTDEQIFKSNFMRFIEVYKNALNGDLDAMKTCLDFCQEEAKYWDRRSSQL